MSRSENIYLKIEDSTGNRAWSQKKCIISVKEMLESKMPSK